MAWSAGLDFVIWLVFAWNRTPGPGKIGDHITGCSRLYQRLRTSSGFVLQTSATLHSPQNITTVSTIYSFRWMTNSDQVGIKFPSAVCLDLSRRPINSSNFATRDVKSVLPDQHAKPAGRKYSVIRHSIDNQKYVNFSVLTRNFDRLITYSSIHITGRRDCNLNRVMPKISSIQNQTMYQRAHSSQDDYYLMKVRLLKWCDRSIIAVHGANENIKPANF